MTARSPKIFIFAGELSGDLHGGALVKALKQELDDLSITGVGGPDLRSQGVAGPLQMEDFMVMGFSDVLKSLPRLLMQFRKVRRHILDSNPDVAIFIDSPSFSLPMAKSLRKAGFKGKIVQYISPTVWAWGKHRAKKMADAFDLLLTIYPFEAQHFSNTSLKVEYVGNPIQESIKKHSYQPQWKERIGINPTAEILALFPGSREGEITRNLPSQLEAAALLQKSNPGFLIAISCAQESNKRIIEEILKNSDIAQQTSVYCIPKEFSYELMKSCRSAIAKSGTVTLELALHHCPSVVIYKLSWLNKMIAKHILKVNLPHYCIVNILAGDTVFPELITLGCDPKVIYSTLKPLYESGHARNKCIAQCQNMQKNLSGFDSSERAAKAILEVCQ